MVWLFIGYFAAQTVALFGYRKIAIGLSLFLWLASLAFFVSEL